MLSTSGLDFLKKTGLTPATFAESLKLHPCPAHLVLGIIATESLGEQGAMRYEPAYPYLFNVKKFAKLSGWTEPTEQALQMFSYGLMQIMLAVARDKGFNLHPMNLLQPKTNVSWGCFHLWSLFRKYQIWTDAIAAYNYGHPAKKLISGKYKNQEYVDRVYFHAAEFQLGDGPELP
jgi:soluble lytic murein transglycosylase-like protein